MTKKGSKRTVDEESRKKLSFWDEAGLDDNGGEGRSGIRHQEGGATGESGGDRNDMEVDMDKQDEEKDKAIKAVDQDEPNFDTHPSLTYQTYEPSATFEDPIRGKKRSRTCHTGNRALDAPAISEEEDPVIMDHDGDDDVEVDGGRRVKRAKLGSAAERAGMRGDKKRDRERNPNWNGKRKRKWDIADTDEEMVENFGAGSDFQALVFRMGGDGEGERGHKWKGEGNGRENKGEDAGLSDARMGSAGIRRPGKSLGGVNSQGIVLEDERRREEELRMKKQRQKERHPEAGNLGLYPAQATGPPDSAQNPSLYPLPPNSTEKKGKAKMKGKKK
ncbi:hypothetical protein EG329_010939 [Mollisiaceae sp. DMI_Dod_QoI]|nr:hypothetical protein EG329_010939 [Helotiales sp. DMI_Dod_QoI]